MTMGEFTWQLTGNVAINTLFSTAFPLFTALYAIRGLKDTPLKPTKAEQQVSAKLGIDTETLYENYSPLLLIGYPIFAVNLQPLGTLALLWGRTAGLVKHLDDVQLENALLGWSKFAQGFTWVTGGICVSALSVWSRRRQKRRQKEVTKKMALFGAPEISLVLFSAIFLPIVTAPIEVFP